MQPTLVILRPPTALLPRVTNPSECGLHLVRADSVAVVLDVHRRDGVRGAVTLQTDGHDRRLRVNGVPNQLHDGPDRVCFVGKPRHEVVACLEHQVGHVGDSREEG